MTAIFMIPNVVRRYLKPKWYSLKFLFISPFYSADIRPGDKVVVLPHEGLGDIFSLLSALNFLASKNDVTLLWNKSVWQNLKSFVGVSDKIECLDFKHNKNYSNPSFENLSKKKKPSFFFLGFILISLFIITLTVFFSNLVFLGGRL